MQLVLMTDRETSFLLAGHRRIAIDGEGHLCNAADWDEVVAAALAEREEIVLTPAHWEIIRLVQDYYELFEHAPAMRALVKYVSQRLGQEKGRSIYLLQLFPGSPARLSARIAGLPRPDHCL